MALLEICISLDTLVYVQSTQTIYMKMHKHARVALLHNLIIPVNPSPCRFDRLVFLDLGIIDIIRKDPWNEHTIPLIDIEKDLAGEDGRTGNNVVGDRRPVDADLDSGVGTLYHTIG